MKRPRSEYNEQDELLATLQDKADEFGGGITFAHVAALEGEIDVLENLFIQEDPVLNQVDHQGCTIAHHAAAKARDDVLDLIHQYAPKLLEVTTQDGENPAHIATRCEGANPKTLMKLLTLCPDLANQLDSSKNSVLHCAILWDKTDILKKLFRKKPELFKTHYSDILEKIRRGKLECDLATMQQLLAYFFIAAVSLGDINITDGDFDSDVFELRVGNCKAFYSVLVEAFTMPEKFHDNCKLSQSQLICLASNLLEYAKDSCAQQDLALNLFHNFLLYLSKLEQDQNNPQKKETLLCLATLTHLCPKGGSCFRGARIGLQLVDDDVTQVLDLLASCMYTDLETTPRTSPRRAIEMIANIRSFAEENRFFDHEEASKLFYDDEQTALQELLEEDVALKEENAALKKENATLKREMDVLRNEIEALKQGVLERDNSAQCHPGFFK